MFDNQASVYQAHCELLREIASGRDVSKGSMNIMLQNIQSHIDHQRSLIHAAIDAAENR